MLNLKQIRYCLDVMTEMFPNAACELVHDNPFELLVAVVLSAQATDEHVNKVTKDLFKKYKTPYVCFASKKFRRLQRKV